MMSSCSRTASISADTLKPLNRCNARPIYPSNDGSRLGHGRHFAPCDKKHPAAGKPAAGREPEALPVHPWSKQHGDDCDRLHGAQIICRRLAGTAVCNDFKRNLLSLVEGAHAGAFDGADMNKNILASLVRLNEAKTLLVVKPLHSSRRHGRSSFRVGLRFTPRSKTRQAHFEFWGGGSSVRHAMCGEAKSFGRKLDGRYMAGARPFCKSFFSFLTQLRQ